MEGCCAEHTFIDCGIREVNLDGCQYLIDLSPIGCVLDPRRHGSCRCVSEQAALG